MKEIIWGVVIAGMGLVLYIIHTILLNHFLAENAPEVTKSGRSKGTRKERRIRIEAITDDDVPRSGIPPKCHLIMYSICLTTGSHSVII